VSLVDFINSIQGISGACFCSNSSKVHVYVHVCSCTHECMYESYVCVYMYMWTYVHVCMYMTCVVVCVQC
jgi:hypothetical protein